MRRLLILMILEACSLAAFAQNGVKGRVVEADGTPVMYASVVLEAAGKTTAISSCASVPLATRT